MKRTFTLFIALFMIGYVNAQLVSYEKIASYTVAQLDSQINSIGYTGFVIPEYPVDLYRVLYRTEFLDSTTVISGVLAVPLNTHCKVPLVTYQHGTSSMKLNSPSYDGAEQNLVIFFAAIGNVVVASDFIGLGASTINLHPYMHHYSQAHSAINLLRATRQLNETLNLNLGNQIFAFGYSQGGSATVAMVKHIEEDYSSEFKITAAAPMSGAYSLSDEQYKMVNSGLPYATPGYLPYVILSYQMMYGNLYTSPSEVFKAPYDTLMPALFHAQTYGMGYINNKSTPVPTNMIIDSVQQAISSNPNHPFRLDLLDNDLINWTPQTRMRLLYCEGDEQVTYRNSVVADSVWNYNGAPYIESFNFGNFDHSGCLPLALLNGKKYFEKFYNDGVEIVVKYDNASNTYTVSLYEDDISNFNILWSNGSTSTTIQNVNPATEYSVTVTHKTKSCTNTRKFTVATILPISNVEKDLVGLKLYPNPAENFITIEISSMSEKATVVNIMGQKVKELDLTKGQNVLDISNLDAGIYFLNVEGKNVNKKFSIR